MEKAEEKIMKKEEPKTTEKNEVIRHEPPKLVKVKGKNYKLVDLENEWIPDQQDRARDLLSKMAEHFDDFGKVEKDNAHAQTAAMYRAMSELKLEKPILALIYIEENEECFEEDTYDERIEAFKKLPLGPGVRQAFKDFFTSKMASMIDDFRTSIGAGKVEKEEETEKS